MLSQRLRVLVATGFLCTSIVWGLPARAQEEAEPEAAPIEATIAAGADPASALTTQDPTIPPDQLELLVRPLTLEELQNEAAAWLVLLKEKVSEISETEITIKRQSKAIEAEKTAASEVEEAKEQLAAAEKAQTEAEPGSPEYEKAVKEVEEAREKLQDAQKAIEEAVKAEEKLQEGDALKAAEESKILDEAKKALEEAKKERDDLEAGSTAYRLATTKIDKADEAIAAVESAEEEFESTVSGSPENEEATAKLEEARKALAKTSSELTGEPLEADSEAEKDLKETASELEKTGSEADLDQGDTAQTERQLEETAEQLEEKAEAEAEIKNQLLVNVTDLQGEQAALIDRFEVVLDALEDKGGDAASYRKYVQAISAITLDVKDTNALGVRLWSWLKSEEGGIRWGIKLATFLLIVAISAIVARVLANLTKRLLSRVGGVSSLFREFIVLIVNRGVLVVGFMIALTSLGISLGPVLALVGGASFVLAFALQSNLGNFASGLMLLVNKPFDVGDEVNVAGYWAYVDSISLASTKLKDFSGNIITLPNNTVWGGDITNYTHADIRKLSITINISLMQDLKTVLSMWDRMCASHAKILKDPAPSAFPWNSSYEYYLSVSLTAWTQTEGFWGVYLDLLLSLQQQLKELNIEMAIAPREINLMSDARTALSGGSLSESPLKDIVSEERG